jgi:hypothetical protein
MFFKSVAQVMKTRALLKVTKTKKDGRRIKAEMATGLHTHLGSCLVIIGNVQDHGKQKAAPILRLPKTRGAIDEDNRREMAERSRVMLGSFWSRTRRPPLRLSRVRSYHWGMRISVGGAMHLIARDQATLAVAPSSTDGWSL